jgi:hypothetical protein
MRRTFLCLVALLFVLSIQPAAQAEEALCLAQARPAASGEVLRLSDPGSVPTFSFAEPALRVEGATFGAGGVTQAICGGVNQGCCPGGICAGKLGCIQGICRGGGGAL